MTTRWRTGCGAALAAAVLAAGLARPVRAADNRVGPDPKEVQAVIDRATDYLRKHQADDGSFPAPRIGPGVSALVAAGVLRAGVSPDNPLAAKLLGYLETKVQKDGGVYDRMLATYTTSVAVMAFAEANTNGRYDTVLKNATRFIKHLQYDDNRVNESDPRYGGLGYDAKSRPDMSNTQMFLEAMQAAGVSKNDPAVQRALKFVSRCQNLPGETNDLAFAKKTSPEDRGGLVYIPDPDDKPHQTAAGGLRSLGAMTYAGLKSFLYAGVGKDDPRVKAAVAWIRNHYTLDENPGQGQSGLYYYYHTFAKAMSALGEDYFVDASGKKHDWRLELFEALKERQRPDGSWINTKDRAFGETDPNLATGFALLTLSYCKAPRK